MKKKIDLDLTKPILTEKPKFRRVVIFQSGEGYSDYSRLFSPFHTMGQTETEISSFYENEETGAAILLHIDSISSLKAENKRLKDTIKSFQDSADKIAAEARK